MAILRVNIRAHIDLRACNVNHLAEYLCETSQRIENEGGCRHTYALPLEFQNWIIHQKPKRRKIGGGIAAPRGSSWGHIYIYTMHIMHACFASLCLFQLCEGVGPAPPSPEQDPGKETLLFSGMEVFSISGRNVWELFLRHGSLSILCVFVRGLEGFEIKLWGLVLGVSAFGL